MRDVRRVDVAHPLAGTEVDGLAVRELARLAVRHVVQRHHAAGAAVRDLSVRSNREPFVHGPAFVGLIMAKGNPTQTLGRNEAADRRTSMREHLAQTGMEKQRFIAKNKELVEGEAGGWGNLRYECRQPIDAVGDFAD